MRDFTKRQWKALLAAYPLYGSAEPSHAETSTQQTVDADVNTTQDLLPLFLRDGVPKVRKAFAEALASESERHISDGEHHAHGRRHGSPHAQGSRSPPRGFSIPPPLTPRREAGDAHWRESIPRDVDALLAYLFRASDGGSCGAPHDRPEPRPFGADCVPLTVVERQLLSLCTRERQRAEMYLASLQQLEQQVRDLAQALLTCVGAPSGQSGTATSDLAGPPRAVPTHATHAATCLLPRLSLLSDSPDGLTPARAPKGTGITRDDDHHHNTALNSSYRSALANTPLTADALAELRHLQAALNADAAASALPAGTLRAANAAVVCAGCALADGELFTCGQCGCVRHESCDGPHPLEAQDDSHLLSLCRACRRNLRVDSGSSSSSLRSSTSTDEREALDREFGTDSDSSNESSLSGFIVNTSEDEEDEDEEGEGQQESTSGDSSTQQGEVQKAKKAKKTPALSSRPDTHARARAKRGRSESRSESESSASDAKTASVGARAPRGGQADHPRRRPPPPRPTTEREADEELNILLNVKKPADASASKRPSRSAKSRRSELLVNSSGSSSGMSDLSDGSSE